jgi:hypothetical protein
MNPQDGAEAWLVERAAIDSVRVDAASRCQDARLERRLQQDERFTRAEGLAEMAVARTGKTLLATQGGDPRAVLSLRSTRAGCDWMIERWADAKRRHEEQGYWNFRELLLAQTLLGVSMQDDVMTPETVHLCVDFLLCKEGGLKENPLVLGAIVRAGWDCQPLLKAHGAINAPETIARANERLSLFIDEKVDELVLRRDTLIEIEERDDVLASQCLLSDFSADGKLLHRYETELLRRVHQSLDHLAKLRKSRIEPDVEASKPSRNEATAPSSLPFTTPQPFRVPLAASSLDDASTIQILCSTTSRNEATVSAIDGTEPLPLHEVASEVPTLEHLPNRPRNEANSPLNRIRPLPPTAGHELRMPEARV